MSNAKDEDQRVAVVLSLDWVEVRQATNLELIAGLRNEYLLDRGETEVIAHVLEDLYEKPPATPKRTGKRRKQAEA